MQPVVIDLVGTIFPSFSLPFSPSNRIESRQVRGNDYYSETTHSKRGDRFKRTKERNKESRIVTCNDNDRPIANFCSLNGTLVADYLKNDTVLPLRRLLRVRAIVQLGPAPFYNRGEGGMLHRCWQGIETRVRGASNVVVASSICKLGFDSARK